MLQRRQDHVHMIGHDGDEADRGSISIKVEAGIEDLIPLFFRERSGLDPECDKVGAPAELPVGEVALMDGEGIRDRGRRRRGRDGLEARPTRTGRCRLRPCLQARLGALLGRERTLGVAAEPVVRHLAVPLITQVRLNRHMAAVGMPHAVFMGHHLLQQRALAALGDGAGVELFDHELASFLAGLAQEDMPALAALFAVPPVLVADTRIGGHDVDHLKIVTLPDHVVVWIVRRGHLEEAGGHLRLGVARLSAVLHGQDDIVILDDRDDPPDDGQHDMHPTHCAGAGVLRVDGHGGIAHVGLGARRRDRDPRLLVVGVVVRVWVATRRQLAPGDWDGGVAFDFLHQRVAEVVEVPVHLLHLHLVVGQRGL